MNIINQELWDRCEKANRAEGMGSIIDFARLWAELMEQTMGDGPVSRVASASFRLANKRYPQSYGSAEYACILLTQTWEHGARLLEWYTARGEKLP